jgi:hypothetical protein
MLSESVPPPARHFADRHQACLLYLQERPPGVERCLYLILCDEQIVTADPKCLLYATLLQKGMTRLALAKRLQPDEFCLEECPNEHVIAF